MNGAVLGGIPSSAALPQDAKSGEDFVAVGLTDFDAAYVRGAGTKDPFPQEKPRKPKLLKFSPKPLVKDEFCHAYGRLLNRADMSTVPTLIEPKEKERNPCYHTWANGITEDKVWGCAQRDIDRDYLMDREDANAFAKRLMSAGDQCGFASAGQSKFGFTE